MAMKFRAARVEDCGLLGELNHQLIQDEGHRSRMSVAELEERMRGWLAGGYRAVIFEEGGQIAGYAMFREEAEEIYLRQLFVARHRRRQGLGRKAVELLRSEVWPKEKRLTVDVLVTNETALKFWRSVGYRDYCMTLEILPEDRGQG